MPERRTPVETDIVEAQVDGRAGRGAELTGDQSVASLIASGAVRLRRAGDGCAVGGLELQPGVGHRSELTTEIRQHDPHRPAVGAADLATDDLLATLHRRSLLVALASGVVQLQQATTHDTIADQRIAGA